MRPGRHWIDYIPQVICGATAVLVLLLMILTAVVLLIKAHKLGWNP